MYTTMFTRCDHGRRARYSPDSELRTVPAVTRERTGQLRQSHGSLAAVSDPAAVLRAGSVPEKTGASGALP